MIQNIIKKRRTIKPEQCTGETIADKTIKELLAMANWAPTHGYTEPWRFIIFNEKSKMVFAQDHAEMYKDNTSTEKFKEVKYQKHLDRAKLTSHIVAIIMKRGGNPKIPVWEEICATACAVQNIMLAATEKNIATYWNSGGMTNHQKMKDYLKLSDEDQCLGFLYIGKPAIVPPKGRRISTIDDKVEWR